MRAGYLPKHGIANAINSRRLLLGVRTLAVLALLWPLLLVCAIAVRLDSDGPVLVQQGGPRFRTVAADGRVTRLGRYLRKAGLDRFPQLLAAL